MTILQQQWASSAMGPGIGASVNPSVTLSCPRTITPGWLRRTTTWPASWDWSANRLSACPGVMYRPIMYRGS
jgi:hypothetical protein